jgi:TonB family protein
MRSFKALKDKDAIKKYGEKGRDGVIEITTYGNKTQSGVASDSSKYRTSISINNVSNKGEIIDIPVSNLQYISLWTDHYLNKTNKKEIRFISIATRDYFKVKGMVVNENKKPLPGVKITATDNPAVETSDKNGRFLINDVREGAILDFSMPEYKTYHLSTLYEVAFNIDLTVQLEKDGKENIDIYEKAEKMPQYPGGDMELLKFIAMNTQYPEAPKTEKAQGNVIVKFIVATEGNVKDPVIFKGVHPALDAEALRVVGKLERFIPGTDGSNPVNVYYYLPITFSLPISNAQK